MKDTASSSTLALTLNHLFNWVCFSSLPLLLNGPLGHHQLQEYPFLLETEVFIGFGPHRYFTLSGRGPCGSGAALLDAGVESNIANQPSAGGAGAGRWKPGGLGKANAVPQNACSL